MADLSSFFENDTVETLAEGHYSSEELLAPGWYKVAIVNEQIKDTSSGGKMLVFECQLDSGSKVNDNFNLVNPNPEAVRIAKSTLGKIAQVIGIKGAFPKDTSVLYGRPYEIYVVRGEYTNKNGEKKPKNEIKDYRPVQAKVSPTPSKATDGW